MVIDWTPTTGLIPCQVQQGAAHELWLSLIRQSATVRALGPRCWKSLSCLSSILMRYAPSPRQHSRVPAHGYWLNTYYWTYNMQGSARPACEPCPSQSAEDTVRHKCPNSLRAVYFSLGSEVLKRSSSNMLGSRYLPILLFRDGSLTLTNVVSLIILVRSAHLFPQS